ncbi:MAG: hypothetical protein U9N46_04370 [Euryarchaeota archaeon]|nr:hypothetical protein [Euryarchaeota archaeon]
MADGPIEADETPCPLTRGEWLAFLAAESQVMSGYEHLAVTVLLVAFTTQLWELYFSTIINRLRHISALSARIFPQS